MSSIAAGAGTATATGTATAEGAAIASGVAAASGVGAAAAVGASFFATIGLSSGIGAGNGVGTGLTAISGTAAGTGSASGQGASIAAAAGTASATGTATAGGETIIGTAGTATGTGTAAGTGTAVTATVGTASGAGTARAISFYFQTTASILFTTADSVDGSWLNELGSNTDLYASIDETPPNANDYIISSINPVSDETVIKMSAPSDTIQEPLAVIHQFRKEGTGSINYTLRLLNGATEIASWDYLNITTALLTVEEVLTTPQFAAITDPTDLYLGFKAWV